MPETPHSSVQRGLAPCHVAQTCQTRAAASLPGLHPMLPPPLLPPHCCADRARPEFRFSKPLMAVAEAEGAASVRQNSLTLAFQSPLVESEFGRWVAQHHCKVRVLCAACCAAAALPAALPAGICDRLRVAQCCWLEHVGLRALPARVPGWPLACGPTPTGTTHPHLWHNPSPAVPTQLPLLPASPPQVDILFSVLLLAAFVVICFVRVCAGGQCCATPAWQASGGMSFRRGKPSLACALHHGLPPRLAHRRCRRKQGFARHAHWSTAGSSSAFPVCTH